MIIKKSYLMEIIRQEVISFLKENDDIQSSTQTSDEPRKSINDEFKMFSRGYEKIQETLKDINKALRKRNLPDLKLNVLKEEFLKGDPKKGTQDDVRYTLKIDGEIPEIKDYEFIAKIEHTEVGNIINTNPQMSLASLPAEYRTFNQKCDICKTNRERLNTFILRKVDTDELIVAGSTCMKRILPLDEVKKFLEYAVRLEGLRRSMQEIEQGGSEFGKGEGGGSSKRFFSVKDVLFSTAMAYFKNNNVYISKAKENETGQESTPSLALVFNNAWSLTGDAREKFLKFIEKNKEKADELVEKIIDWANTFDWDEAMVKNPSFENYYSNLKVLSKKSFLEYRHFAYVASMLAVYIREEQSKKDFNKELKADSQYIGVVGEKITVEVKLVRINNYNTAYGYGTIFTFEDKDGNELVWFSSGDDILFKDKYNQYKGTDKYFKINGTIKSHQVNKYNNKKQTVLTRVKDAEKSKDGLKNTDIKLLSSLNLTHKDGVWNSYSSVYLNDEQVIKKLVKNGKFIIKFGTIGGNFGVGGEEITSLEGFPEVVKGFFVIQNTKITSLEGGPKVVGGKFDCSYNKQLTSLEGAPNSVKDFDCSYTSITSLKGAPESVTDDFNCSNTNITSLEGAPKSVKDFNCSNTDITSLKGAPDSVQNFFCNNNPKLTSLDGFPENIFSSVSCKNTKITSFEGFNQNTKYRGNFDFSDNSHLISLEGLPEEVIYGDFICKNTKITSLKGSPMNFVGDFDCSNNSNLISLEGCPRLVAGKFYLTNSGKKFTEEEVESVCKAFTLKV